MIHSPASTGPQGGRGVRAIAPGVSVLDGATKHGGSTGTAGAGRAAGQPSPGLDRLNGPPGLGRRAATLTGSRGTAGGRSGRGGHLQVSTDSKDPPGLGRRNRSHSPGSTGTAGVSGHDDLTRLDRRMVDRNEAASGVGAGIDRPDGGSTDSSVITERVAPGGTDRHLDGTRCLDAPSDPPTCVGEPSAGTHANPSRRSHRGHDTRAARRSRLTRSFGPIAAQTALRRRRRGRRGRSAAPRRHRAR
jgi:hypothetical protein